MSKIDKKIVRLTGKDLKRAATVGMGREDAKTVAGWLLPSTTATIYTSEEDLGNKIYKYIREPKHRSHFLGLLGELAYAKFVGGEINEEIYFNRGDDGRGDVGSAEVKASTWKGDDIELKVTQREYNNKERPEKYVLVRVSERTPSMVEMVGEESAERFEAEKRVKQYRPGYPVNYIMGADDLDEVACA